jgi:hypothetical protein
MKNLYVHTVSVPKFAFWYDGEGMKYRTGPYLFWEKLIRDYGPAGGKWSALLGGFTPSIRFKNKTDANNLSVYLSLFK